MSDSSAAGRLMAATNANAAQWVAAGVRDFAHDVGSVVPACFEAYARLFHPAVRGEGGNANEVRWNCGWGRRNDGRHREAGHDAHSLLGWADAARDPEAVRACSGAFEHAYVRCSRDATHLCGRGDLNPYALSDTRT
jgi:hypothetical protein